jgi:hypothetical protein
MEENKMYMELEDMVQEVERRWRVADGLRERVLLETALDALKKAHEIEKEKPEKSFGKR